VNNLIEQGFGIQAAKTTSHTARCSEPWFPLARLQTFFEVLWRTLIADYWDGQHPAPLDAGYAFVGTLVYKIQLLIAATAATHSEIEEANTELSSLRAENDTKKLVDEQTKRLTILNLLAESEFDGFTMMRKPASGTDEEPELWSSINPLLDGKPKEWVESKLTRFLPEFDNAQEIFLQKVDHTRLSLWRTRFGQVMAGRKLFRTEDFRFLGCGTRSLMVGDWICILAGGHVPYIIRPVNDGKDKRFYFVGEAYVHGFMYGNPPRTKRGTPGEIILV